MTLAKTDTKKQDKAFAALIKKAKSAYKPEPAEPLEPIAQLVFSFLCWNATTRQADTAFGKIMSQVVDFNELRVSHAREVVEMIGVRYPDADSRVIRMLEAMNEIFDREHDYRMTSAKAKGKREQREYLDSLPGMPPFVAARVALLAFGAHAMPVDDRLLSLMVKAEVFDPETKTTEAEAWLTRQIKAGEAEEAYLALQEWSDNQRVTAGKPAKAVTNSTASKPPATKKTTTPPATRTRVAKKK